MVAFPDADLDGAVAAAERMRAAVEAMAVPHPGLEAGGVVTMSGGAASFDAGDTVAALLERADQALYEAKEAGRNRVVVSGARAASASG